MAIVSGLTIVAIVLMNLSYPEWTGGWTTGPRLLVPLLPFALLPVAALLAVGGRATTALAIGLALLGAVVILMFEAVGARIPDGIARPLVDAVWPLWRGGTGRSRAGLYGNRYARNPASLAFARPCQGPADLGGLGSVRPAGPVPGRGDRAHAPIPETPTGRASAGDPPARGAGVDLRFQGGPDPRRGQLGHAFEPRAVLEVARGAPDAGADGDGLRAVGAGPDRAGAGVDTHRPGPGRGGQVERAGVVGEEDVDLRRQTAASWGRFVRPQRSRAAIGPSATLRASTSGRSSGAPTRTRARPRASTARRATAANCSGGQRLVSQRAPTLTPGPGRAIGARIAAAQAASSAANATRNRGRRHVGRRRPGDLDQAVDRVGLGRRRGDPVVIEQPGPLAGIGQADPDRRPGGERHDPRSGAGPGGRRPGRTGGSGGRPGTGRIAAMPLRAGADPGPVEGDHLVEVRVAVEEAAGAPVDDPGDPGVGPEVAEGREDREGVDDVAQRARLDQADPVGSEAPEGGRRSGRIAGTPFPPGTRAGILAEPPPSGNRDSRPNIPGRTRHDPGLPRPRSRP